MSGAGEFQLSAGEIRVWEFALELDAARARQVEAWLAPEELARADAFHFARDRAHFVAARGRLRELLGGCLGCAPAAVRFVVGSHGKPALAPGSAADDLRFNLSHSHGRALLAVTRGAEVGVDLEQIRDDVDAAGIVAGHFSPAERAGWERLPEARRCEAFFHGWVRKEAYVKARGEGLARTPSAYTVGIEPAGPASLVADDLDPGAPARWLVERLPVSTGYVAAVSYSAPARVIRLGAG